MATFSNGTKQSASTFSNKSRAVSTMYNRIKPGQAPAYDSYLTYDEDVDPISNNARFYDTIGTLPTYTNKTKS